jgi:hypothetical protein
MQRSRFLPTFALALFCAAPLSFAEPLDDVLLERDSSRPAIGEWTGAVSWNEPIATYAWSIYSDGTFISGRLGRGQNGGGTWGADGAQVTLKYEDGFRYQGELVEDDYAGEAYDARGRRFGAFSMHRFTKGYADSFEAP